MAQIYTYTTGWLKAKNGTTGDFKFTATIELNSQNQQANTSNITCTMTMFCNNNGSTLWNASAASNQPRAELTGDVSATGNGIKTYKKSTTPLTVITWTGDITHDNNGTKTISVDFDWIAGGLEWYPATQTMASASVALPTIARAATINVSSRTISNDTGSLTASANIMKKWYYVLEATIGATTWQIDEGTEQVGGRLYSIDYADILDAMPATTSATLTLELIAYTDNTKSVEVARTSASATMTVDTNALTPSTEIWATMIDYTPIPDVIVAGYTRLKIAYTTAARYGANALTNTFTCSDATMTPSTSTTIGSGTSTSSALRSSTSDYTTTFGIQTTDSRGAVASNSITVSVKGYRQPVISATAYRCTSGGTRDESGAYVKCDFSATRVLVAEGNTGSVSATLNGNAYTSGSVVSLPEGSTATFVITANDNCTTVNKTVKVGKALIPFDLYDDGTSQHLGAAIAGPIAEADKIKLGNAAVQEVNMMNAMYRWLANGTVVNFISGNATNADNLLPTDADGDVIAGAVSLAFATSNSGRTNWPTTGQRGVMLTIALSAGAGTYGVQFCYMNATNNLYMRYKSTTWTAWKSLTFS